ncbi:MAG: FAD-binding protein [Anaerolineae bacterium]|nr:FAD-binding protein [Anaerolineae bacterium]
MSDKAARRSVDRRTFVKGSVISAGAMALAGMTTQPVDAQGRPIHWDRETDVIVVGYGGAGAAAAITAHDEGAEVIILEKTDAGGGSTYYSGGYFVSPTDVEGAKAYLTHCAIAGAGQTFELDDAFLTAWAEEAVRNVEWIESIGGAAEVSLRGWYSAFEGAESYTSYQPAGNRTGVGLWEILATAVEERGIEVIYNTAATRLVTRTVLRALEDEAAGDEADLRPREADTEVLGVLASTDGVTTAIKARKAVILTCGGFECNETMKRNYLGVYPIFSVGTPAATGDAIKLAADVDAALWHMGKCGGNLCHKLPRVPVAFPSMLQLGAAGKSVIFVDQQGKRFVNETLPYDAILKAIDYYDPGRQEWPRIPCWCIFDEKTRTQGPAGLSVPIGKPIYTWSADNSAEIASGDIIQADTIEELAEALGMDPDALLDTVDEWNAAVDDGEDAAFGRALGLIAIDEPPFYALAGYPGTWGTGGGPRIDARAQVQSVRGRPIPRLYAAGNASGVVYPFLYPLSGTMIADAFVMGRIAGANAAAEEPAE